LVEHRLVAANALGSNPDIPLNYLRVRHEQRSCQHTLARQKKKKSKTLPNILELLNDVEKMGLIVCNILYSPGKTIILKDYQPFFCQ
jgi:hypothetical protein